MCKIVCVLTGGPTYRMHLSGKIQPFEMHPQMGPCALSRRDGSTPLEANRQPKGFFDAYERWELGGKQLDCDVCLVPEWCDNCKGSGCQTQYVGGRHYEYVGVCPACQGKRIIALVPDASGEGEARG